MIRNLGTNISLSVLVILMLLGAVFAILPVAVSAQSEGGYTYTVSDGKATITSYSGEGGAITIPSTLGGYPVVAIGEYAFFGRINLTSVVVPDSVTAINGYAFFSCLSMTSINIPDDVATIGTAAFADCDSLTTISLPRNVVSVGIAPFADCDSLTAIGVDSGNVNFASIDGVLYNKTIATLIQFPGGKSGAFVIPDGVITIANSAFDSAASLTSVTIPLSVANIDGYAFFSCSSLTSISVPSNVTFIGIAAFAGCSSLTAIDVDSGNVNFASIDGVLYNKTITTLMQCPGGKTGAFVIPSSVTSISATAFYECSSLTLVTIPENVTSIGDYAFFSCISLTSIDIPGNVTSIGNAAFAACSSLTAINVDGSATFASIDGVLYNKTITTLIQCPGGKSGAFVIPSSVTSIGSSAFESCTYLTSVTIPESVTSIRDWTFSRCSSLASINIPSNVTSIRSYAFSGCTSLTSITIPAKVNLIGYRAFSYCSSMTSITFEGLEAPTFVGRLWILGTSPDIRGHAYAASNFPAPGGKWNDLMMGAVIPVAPNAPSSLSAIPGNAQVVLTWTAPSDDGGAPVTGYRVYSGTTSSGETVLITLGNVLTYTHTGLTNGLKYYYKVSAINSIGEGVQSIEASATPATVPTAPQNLQTVFGDSNITLIWQVPSSNGGASIVGYKVYRSTTPGGETLLDTVGNVLNYTNTGLTNGVTYYYKISAVNSAGEGAKSFEASATPATIPDAPQNLLATSGDAFVNLTWEASPNDGGSDIINYQVWRGTSTGTKAFLANNGLELWYNDTGLSNGQTYYYMIRAQNSVGVGPFSNEASATPAQTVTVPTAPSLASASEGDAQVVLVWTAPNNNGGSAITDYNIYRGTTSGGETLLETVGNVLTFTDSGLTNGVTYYYMVSAINSVGEGVLSNELNATPTAAPTVPSSPILTSAIAGDAQIVISWTAPSSDGGAAITDYNIYRGTTSGGETLLDTVGNVLSYTSTGLTNGVTYYYKVSAINSVGEGALSNELSAKPMGLPSAPQSLEGSPGDTFITLTWQAPASNGGSSIIAYNVYRGTTSGGEMFLTTLGNVLTYTDPDLTNGLTYHYKVSAMNSVGEGARSNGLVSMPVGPPTAPLGLEAVPGNAYINLTWAAPASDGGSAIVKYNVWRSTTSGEETFLANAGNRLWYNNTGLLNGLTYYYKVSAVNSVGEGMQSSEASAKPSTIPAAPSLASATSGNAQVALIWAAPANNGGSSISGYNVYRGAASGEETLLMILGDVLTFTDSGLTNGATYYYKVSAVNSVGEGAFSNELSAIPATIPAAPSLASATSGNAQVALIWAAPADNGGSAIVTYKVYRGTTSGGETLLDTVDNVLTFTNTGLTNGVTYYYKVSAVNSVGEGALSNELSAKPSTVPTAPTSVSVTSGNAQATLTWAAPANNGGLSITGYKVLRGTTSGGEVLLITVGNVLAYTDMDLTNGQPYYYKVSAVNSDGEGALSEEVSVTPVSPSPDNGFDWTWIIIAIVVVIAAIAAFLLYRRYQDQK